MQTDKARSESSKILPLIGALQTRLDMLQIGVDRLLIDRNESNEAALKPHEAERHLHQHMLLDAMRAPQIEIPKLIERFSAVHAESLQLLSLLLSRSDHVLQRIAIPLGCNIVMRTPEGFLLLPSEDPVLVTSVWESGGRPGPGTIKVLTTLLREGDHTIDVGSNVGLTVLPAARRVGPAGRVIAFEPKTRARCLLRRSLALNFLSDRILLYPYAAGQAWGTAHLNLGQALGHASLLALPGSEKGKDVEMRTIDSLVPQGERIRLAMLNAAGFELQVWRGMQRVINENPDLLVLVEFDPEHLRRAGISIEDWLAEFRAPGFTPYEVDGVTGNLRQLRPMAELTSAHPLNLLLLRQPPTAFPELHFE